MRNTKMMLFLLGLLLFTANSCSSDKSESKSVLSNQQTQKGVQEDFDPREIHFDPLVLLMLDGKYITKEELVRAENVSSVLSSDILAPKEAILLYGEKARYGMLIYKTKSKL